MQTTYSSFISKTHMTLNKLFSLQGFHVYFTHHSDGTAHDGFAIIKNKYDKALRQNAGQSKYKPVLPVVTDWVY